MRSACILVSDSFQHSSQDFQKGFITLHGRMSDVTVCIHKHARLGRSGGILPQEKLDALRSFWDRNRAIVAIELHPVFAKTKKKSIRREY